MKLSWLILLVVFQPLFNIALCQYPIIKSFDFEGHCLITISEDTSNIWQIGTPQKTCFNHSRSGVKAIITDTIAPYPPNNHSSFWFTIYKQDYISTLGLYFVFFHNFCLDIIADSAFVDYSADGGISWYLGVDGRFNSMHSAHQRFYIDLNHGGDTRNPIISGLSGGWVFEEYFWMWDSVKYMLPDELEDYEYPDSIIVRFNFISDSMHNEKDGWMIDDISISKIFYSSVNDYYYNDLKIFPNPIISNMIIKTNKQPIKSMTIVDLKGNCVYSNTKINSNEVYQNLEFLESGLYLLYVTNATNKTRCTKFIKY